MTERNELIGYLAFALAIVLILIIVISILFYEYVCLGMMYP
jgi:hypothetical protein